MEEFCSLTGCSEDIALSYLEASNFNLEVALQLFFDSAGPAVSQDLVSATSQSELHPLVKITFEGPIQESWKIQSLSFDKIDQNGISTYGIFQNLNGPCGIVAIVLAYILKYSKENQTDEENILSNAILQLLSHINSSNIQICSWIDQNPNSNYDNITTMQLDSTNIPSCLHYINTIISQYTSSGGAILLVYSAISTFQLSKFNNISTPTQATPTVTLTVTTPLINGPFQLCSSALMNLFLIGYPLDNMNAYDPISGNLIDYSLYTSNLPLPIGFLSGSEYELKIRIHDIYKNPTSNIYILHGCDHFTVGYIPNIISNSSIDVIPFIHWNGLPPNGPKLTFLTLNISNGIIEPLPLKLIDGIHQEYKPVIGTIDSVIQSNQKNKKLYPKNWIKWKYEIALVIDDPTNVSPDRPSDLPKGRIYDINDYPIIAGDVWRCRRCYEVGK